MATSTHEPPVRPGTDVRWTVMVFMGADNPPDEADLTEAAQDDIAEMEQAASKRSSSTLRVVYQLHGKNGATRRRLGDGSPEEAVPRDVQEATDGTPLLSFLDWARRRTDHRSTDHSMLILWGHAHKFAIGARQIRGAADALDFGELAQVLQRVQDRMREYQQQVGRTLDIVAFDACDAATLEMAYQLHPFAKYLLASQIRMPIPGFPYARILDRVAEPHGRVMGPAELGTWAVRRFCEHYSSEKDRDSVSLTLLDLQQAPAAVERTERLARALARGLGDGAEDPDVVADLFRSSRILGRQPKPFVDVADLCLNLIVHCETTAVETAARALGDLLLSPKPVEEGESETGAGRPVVVEHGGNASTTARLNGVSLYAPHVAGNGFDALALATRYSKFAFAEKTLWGDLVTALARL